jgi:hypothetical protein
MRMRRFASPGAPRSDAASASEHPGYLAAAQAAAGRFDLAVTTCEAALALKPSATVDAAIRQREALCIGRDDHSSCPPGHPSETPPSLGSGLPRCARRRARA